jgi:hypothetical protein
MYRSIMENKLDSILKEHQPSESSGSKFYQVMRVDGLEHFLEIRFRDGIRTAFAYEKLGWFNYSPETNMLDLDFMGTTVSIEGRGLMDLFQSLKARRVSWVKEADTELEDNDTNSCFVKEITILPPEIDFDDKEENS